MSSFLEGLIPLHLARAVRERRLNVASGPAIEDLSFEEGQPLTVEATYEVFPDFELGDYRGSRSRIASRK